MNGPARARLFVAVEIGDDARRELSRLPRSLPDAKFVRADQLHVTLRFLGETDRTRIEPLRKSLAGAAAQSTRFSIAIRGIGTFPPRRPPRVLRAELEHAEPLVQLAASVESACIEAGFPSESRPFSPHVTLARFRTPPPAEQISSYIEAYGRFRTEPFEVGEVILFESVLSSSGPTYTRLAALRPS